MKNRRVPQLLALSWLAAMTLWPGSAAAYDSPDFDFGIFSSDGVLLPEEQRSILLEALAAIASNFTDNPRVDDDLREKALSLSLRLDPMHYHSRLAHRELTRGATPSPTAYFDSLTLISETLWNLAKKLSSPPLQPDSVQLAPYLMELSMITQPDPSIERLELYAMAIQGEFPLWENFTTLQPEANRSTSRTISIRSEASAILERKKDITGTVTPAAINSKPQSGNPAPPLPISTGPPVVTSLIDVPAVLNVGGNPISGSVSLTMRPPGNEAERMLLAATSGSSLPRIPLVASSGNFPVGVVSLPPALAAERSWAWPSGAIGEIEFISGQSPVSGFSARSSVLTQAAILVDSLLGKKPLNADFVSSGECGDLTSPPSLSGDPLETIRVAGVLKSRYLLMPASALDALVSALQKTGQLSLIFQTELIGYSSLGEALDLATSPTAPALIEASMDFDEIEAVSNRMSFPELSRNAKVQERLDAILIKFPGHLSARAMLEFGRRPLSSEQEISQFAGQIDALVRPFVSLDEIDNISAARETLSDAERQLTRLRLTVPAEAKELIPTVEDFLEACGLYLDLSNRNTTIAFQRFREANEALGIMESTLDRLGLSLDSLAAAVVIEGESLDGSSAVSGGQTSVQDMSGFRGTWSGDYQLWLRGGRPGDICKLSLGTFIPGTRTITLHMTRGRDYAVARVSIGNLFKEVDFYSADVDLGDPLVFNDVEVSPGETIEITFEIIGANPDAEPRYFLGVDRIEVN